jgi:hypothetical protein
VLPSIKILKIACKIPWKTKCEYHGTLLLKTQIYFWKQNSIDSTIGLHWAWTRNESIGANAHNWFYNSHWANINIFSSAFCLITQTNDLVLNSVCKCNSCFNVQRHFQEQFKLFKIPFNCFQNQLEVYKLLCFLRLFDHTS